MLHPPFGCPASPAHQSLKFLPLGANNYDRQKNVSAADLRSIGPNEQREVLIPAEVPGVQVERFREAIPDQRPSLKTSTSQPGASTSISHSPTHTHLPDRERQFRFPALRLAKNLGRLLIHPAAVVEAELVDHDDRPRVSAVVLPHQIVDCLLDRRAQQVEPGVADTYHDTPRPPIPPVLTTMNNISAIIHYATGLRP